MSEESGPIRLSKLLAQRGICSRREAEAMFADGRVTVNGEIVRQTVEVDPAVDAIRVDGRALPREPHKVYYLLYKPKGVITSRADPRGRRSVFDLMESVTDKIEPVGRLDFDTEGALLLTNDGDLAHQLTHPSSRVPKRYLAKVYRTPDESDLQRIRDGKVYLEDGAALPALARITDATDAANAWVEVTVTEGRNRLIRRLFAQLGHPVSKLRRESFATISITGMERGTYRALQPEEVRRLKDIAAGRNPKRAGKTKRKAGFAIAKPKRARPGAKVRKPGGGGRP